MNLKRLFLAVIMSANAGLAHAGTSNGTVSYILAHEPGVLIFQAGNISNKAACNTENQWAISLNDPVGKPMLAILLSAQAQGKSVWTYGYSKTCRDWADRELPSFLQIVD